MDLQELLNKAQLLYKAGEQNQSLDLYNKAFEKLSDEAGMYAHTQPYTVKDEKTPEGENIRTVLPRYFEVTKSYLKQDKTAYILLKNMAVIYHELNDDSSAIHALEQAIDLAPDGEDVSSAISGIEKLKPQSQQ